MGQTLVSDHFKLLSIFIILCILCSFPIPTNSLTIKLVRRDHVDSSLFPKNLTAIEKHRIYADLGLSRALHLSEQAMSLANPSLKWSAGSLVANTISPKLSQLRHSAFVVPMKIGSQQYSTYLLLDTGSSFTWIQCRGCSPCFKLRGKPFDPKHSSSYRPLPFDSPLCRKSFRKGQNTCGFNVRYASSIVEGTASLENVVFTAATGPPVTVRDVVLGCASSAPKTLFDYPGGPNNPIAGILGLALGPYQDSFMTRSQGITKLTFSYCLPPWNETEVKTNMLFGDDVQPLPRSAQSTPLTMWQQHINCHDVSVAGQPLHLDPALFQLQPDGSGGFFMDTGAGGTYLVGPAYRKIKEAFVQALRSYMEPRPPVKPYDLCYSWPFPRIPRLPSLTYHFLNANLEVDFWNTFQTIELSRSKKVVCMMIHPFETRSMNLLGAVQQANYRFVHNLRTHTLTFYPEKCRGN